MSKIAQAFDHGKAFIPFVTAGDPDLETTKELLPVLQESGADLITVHLEACGNVEETLDCIHGLGCRAGLSIKPGTDVEKVKPYLSKIDMLLVMTVEPGFGGQKYLPQSTDRIRQAREMIRESGLPVDIEVDGGITKENVSEVLEAGANVIVAGSAVFRGDISENVRALMEQLKKAETEA